MQVKGKKNIVLKGFKGQKNIVRFGAKGQKNDCVPHRRKLRWSKLTLKETSSKRKIAERNITEIEISDRKIFEIEMAELFL
jgi:uncharacterized Rossmann fold enzyme